MLKTTKFKSCAYFVILNDYHMKFLRILTGERTTISNKTQALAKYMNMNVSVIVAIIKLLMRGFYT